MVPVRPCRVGTHLHLERAQRTEHQRGRLGDGHEIANDLRVSKGDRATGSNLAPKKGHYGS